MGTGPGIGAIQRLRFGALFSADWILGQNSVDRFMAQRWDTFHRELLAKASRNGEGGTFAVDRRRHLTPEEFKERYFLTGIPVVLEGAASHWPAIEKWTPDYLLRRCGQDEIAVLDAHNWRINRDGRGLYVGTYHARSRSAA